MLTKTATPTTVTMSNCTQYAVIDPVFRDRVAIPAERRWGLGRFLQVKWHISVENAAIEGAKRMKLVGTPGWDAFATHRADIKAVYRDGITVVDVHTDIIRTNLSGGFPNRVSRVETVTVYLKPMGPNDSLEAM